MVYGVLYFTQKFCFWMGLMLVGVTLMVLGLKLYEHATYVPAQAKIVGLSTKCEMSYRKGRRDTVSHMVECAQVAKERARTPDIDWTVRQVVFVDIAYSAGGRVLQTNVRRSKLERDTAVIGEVIPILYAPDDPLAVTGPANRGVLIMMGLVLALGLGLLALSRFAWRARRGRLVAAGGYA